MMLVNFAALALGLAICSWGFSDSGAGTSAGEAPSPTLTVLYDNYPFQPGCDTDWGFAALIEGLEKTILFDTGTKGDILLKNLEALKIDPSRIDLIVISHAHGDHTGGLPAVLKKRPGVPVYAPSSFVTAAMKSAVGGMGSRLVAVTEPLTLFPGAMLTGDLGEAILEQALVLDTPRGSFVLTGCAHPGIVPMIEKIKEIRKADLAAVLGGFHLYRTAPLDVAKIIARFEELGVKRVGASHCTGEAAIEMFRKSYGPGFIELGVGRRIDLGSL